MSTMCSPQQAQHQKVGLVLAGVMSAGNIPSVFTRPPKARAGPPMAILAVGRCSASSGWSRSSSPGAGTGPGPGRRRG